MEAVTATGPCWLPETGFMFRPPTRRTVHVVAIKRTADIAETVFSVSFMAMALGLKVSAGKSLICRVMTDYRSEAPKAAKHVSETLCGTTVPRKVCGCRWSASPALVWFGVSLILIAGPLAMHVLVNDSTETSVSVAAR